RGTRSERGQARLDAVERVQEPRLNAPVGTLGPGDQLARCDLDQATRCLQPEGAVVARDNRLDVIAGKAVADAEGAQPSVPEETQPLIRRHPQPAGVCKQAVDLT